MEHDHRENGASPGVPDAENVTGEGKNARAPAHRLGSVRPRFRMIAPAFPAFNIYSRIARRTTALGPLSVATAVNRMDGWNVEVIDENNYRNLGPRDAQGRPDHRTLQAIRRADVVDSTAA